jgi:SAM-dependent methyltransferase
MSYEHSQAGLLHLNEGYNVKNCDTLSFNYRDIRRVANSKWSCFDLTKILFSQAWWELSLRLTRHIDFRKRENMNACQAYSKMSPKEFEWINARQQWANWRTIPKSLSGLVADSPLVAIDLCCGVGHSTEVLAYYLPSGSKLIGLEFNPNFVKKAAEKTFYHRSRKIANVAFHAQSVLEIFTDNAGRKIESETVDLVNSSGAVGCHFDLNATDILAAEVKRVLKKGGLATIDSGSAGTSTKELVAIFERHGFIKCQSVKSCFFDLYTQVCFTKGY